MKRPGGLGLVLLLILSSNFSSARVLSQGPGLPQVTFKESQRFKVIGKIQHKDMPYEHGTAAFVNGYVVVPFADNTDNGGFGFLDLSNPSQPKIVKSIRNPDIREGHSMGFTTQAGKTYAVTQGARGIHFWDWTDPLNPQALHYLRLPGIEPSDYDNGVWWLFWQAPYVYVGGSSRGLFIVDAADPKRPKLVQQLTTRQTGGFRVGPVFAVGNLLVASGNNVTGFSTFDISNPSNPVLLATNKNFKAYSSLLNGNQLLLAGADEYNGLITFDLTDPRRPRYSQRIQTTGKGGYLLYQDGFAHLGSSTQYFKIDIRDPGKYKIEGAVSFGESGADLDFVTPLGNLALLGDDHGYGTRVAVHQTEPDTLAPSVNMVSPKSNESRVPVTSRVGVTLSDQIDLRTVNSDTFSVRVWPDGQTLEGQYSGQSGILNFFPKEPLLPNTTYEIRIRAGGLHDISGNPIAQDFVSQFSTGAKIGPSGCRIQAGPPSLVGQEVTMEIGCEQPAGKTYSWNFGDGSPITAPSEELVAQHSYLKPGHYTVVAYVHSEAGERAFSSVQTVTLESTEAGASHSGTLALDAKANLLWVINPDHDSVTTIDAAKKERIRTSKTRKGPRNVAIAPNGAAWVTNQKDDSISIFESQSGRESAVIKLRHGARPYGIVFDPETARAYVSLEGSGQLAEIDSKSRELTRTLDLGSTPRAIAINAAGSRLYVTRFISPVDQGEIYEIDTSTLKLVTKIPLAHDPGPDTSAGSRGVPNYLTDLAISVDGRHLWVTSKKDNTRRGKFLSGEPLTFESTVRAILSKVDLAIGQEELKLRQDLNNRNIPSAIAFNRRGDYAFIATLGSNTVDIMDALSGEILSSIENIGFAPDGLTVSPDDSVLFVHNFLGREVLAIDLKDIGEGNQFPILTTIKTTDREALSDNVLRGKRIFYNSADRRMTRDKYISCASCHLDGGSDHRVWDFTDRGEGLRRTTLLTGRAGTEHGPIHWSGNFDEIQDFEHDMRGPFGGTGFMSDERFNAARRNEPLGGPKGGKSQELDDLAKYVGSLDEFPRSPFRAPDGKLTPSAMAGKRIFEKDELKCATCHSYDHFTDSPFGSSFHDVGTIKPSSGSRLGKLLGGIDTPTLRGIWQNPSFLHDGSAPTLMDVLTTANPQDRHGVTSKLNLLQKQQLVDYLLQLE